MAAALAGCSSSSSNSSADSKQSATQSNTKSAAKAAADQTEAGREALQKMYAAAHNWAIDAQPVSLSSNPRAGDAAGKAAVWSASFASATKHAIRNFTWSGAAGKDAPDPGVSQGSVDIYSPENASTRPFDMNFLKIDSDAAFEEAQKHGGATLLKKTPDTLVRYSLLSDPRALQLSWRIQYGTSGATSKLTAIVNASTGKFMRIEK